MINSKKMVLLTIFLIILMSVYDVLFWFTDHGGVLSFISAIYAVKSRSVSIEIDGNGLRLPIIIAISLAFGTICARISINISSKIAVQFLGFCIIGTGFLLGSSFGSFLISRFMIAHGYIRCSTGDFVVGKGRGRVFFDDYFLANESCVSRR